MDEDNKESKKEEQSVDFENLKKERDEYLDGWKRAKADLINYKKEEAQRMEQFVKYSTQAVIADLVTVLDSFDLGLSVINDGDPARKGVVLIKNQLEDILRKRGLEKIAVKKGSIFDPSLEEAVEEVESDSPPGTISEEVASGYKLNGKLIRPVRVKISKIKNQGQK